MMEKRVFQRMNAYSCLERSDSEVEGRRYFHNCENQCTDQRRILAAGDSKRPDAADGSK
jgi:hypothetical protein